MIRFKPIEEVSLIGDLAQQIQSNHHREYQPNDLQRVRVIAMAKLCHARWEQLIAGRPDQTVPIDRQLDEDNDAADHYIARFFDRSIEQKQ